MKHLIIIASSTAFISSCAFAMEHNITFHNNLSNSTTIIINTSGPNCPLKNPCSIAPKQTRLILVHRDMVIVTPNMNWTPYALDIPKPAPKNISFTDSYKNGHNYIDVWYDGKFYNRFMNEYVPFPDK